MKYVYENKYIYYFPYEDSLILSEIPPKIMIYLDYEVDYIGEL